MAQPTQRGGVRDLNAERAAQADKAQAIQQVDTFAPVQSTVFGQTQVQSSPLLNSLAKFGTEIGAIEMEKTARANFLAGQTMRASGQEMRDNVAPPTRRGFKAMGAKIRTEEWYREQKKNIDNGANAADPLEYSESLSKNLRDMMTGDSELDNMMTESALPLMQDLGRYQADANVKRRRADSIAQTTADITGTIEDLKAAQKSGDVKGENAARVRLLNAMKMPVISDPALRQQTYADVTALALDMGDPTALNYVREQGIEFSPDQEKSILAAKKRWTAQEKTKLDTVYQHDLGDMEASLSQASTLAEMREATAQFQERYPEKKSNAYYAGLERQWRENRAKTNVANNLTEFAMNGDLAKVPGVTNKQQQETFRAIRTQINSNPDLTPEEKESQNMAVWSNNNLTQDDLKTRWNAGMTNPLQEDGTLHPDFENSYGEFVAHHRKNPDLAMQHLSEENRLKYKNIFNLKEYGGMALRDAAATIEANKKNARDLTSDERNAMRDSLNEEVDTVMGKGFFSYRAWTDAVGATTPIRNEGMVRERISRLAETYMQTGYTDPEAATEAARVKMMETHEQVGDSLVYNGGKSLAKRMQIGAPDLAEAIEYQKQGILEANPDFDGDNLVIMGDPLSNALMFGNLNENGVLTDVVSTDLAAAGAAFHNDVVKPREQLQRLDMDAADKNRERKIRLLEEAVSSGIYTEAEAETALSNWLGSFVVESRMQSQFDANNPGVRQQLRDEFIATKQLQDDLGAGGIAANRANRMIDTYMDEQTQLLRDQAAQDRRDIQEKEMNDNGIGSAEEYQEWKRARKYLNNQNTPEQARLLESGKLDEYERNIHRDLPKAPDNSSPEAFARDALRVTRTILEDTSIFPEVAAAQAALESGWGRSVKGGNYFGIKGQGQTFMTHEIVDGKRVDMEDSFRTYGGFVESVQGLRDFLYENPRYQKALEAGTAEEQARLLQEAGYATDPDYADKLINIMNQPRFK